MAVDSGWTSSRYSSIRAAVQLGRELAAARSTPFGVAVLDFCTPRAGRRDVVAVGPGSSLASNTPRTRRGLQLERHSRISGGASTSPRATAGQWLSITRGDTAPTSPALVHEPVNKACFSSSRCFLCRASVEVTLMLKFGSHVVLICRLASRFEAQARVALD